ncbi:hypothetical protein [Glaciibacter superstes]|uniref:baeRF11 domain-containing protein n=1 Tax=Glaciibacter superstes TaxID=501023 RepID=UPI0003B4F5BB|nr:hypothetical protein [Glaciibacter superstes]
MTTRPQQRDVQRIADVRAPWCVTIYGEVDSWLRGNHASEKADAQIRSSMDGLHIGGAPSEILEAIRDHLSRLSAWSPSTSGGIDRRVRSVGIFATENGAEMFVLTTSPTLWVGVADRFLVSPLLEGALALIPPVFALAISETKVRLVDVTALPVEVVEVPGLPQDLASTIALDLTGDRNTLAHLRTSEDPKGRLREYARAIERTVEPVLRRAGAALVIAAAQPLASIYRSMTAYDLVVSSTIVGNHDADSFQELADFAAPIIEHHRREILETQLARLAELPNRDLVLGDLDEIAEAARNGAIDTLFVDTDRRVPVRGEAFEGLTTIDRVDEIIRDALSSDTTVVPVRPGDLPTPDPLAAVLRYMPAGQQAR